MRRRIASGWSSVVTGGPLRVTFNAPASGGTLGDLSLRADSGAHLIEAAQHFSGLNIAFTVSGGGASIDASSGRLQIPTNQLREQETVTVPPCQGSCRAL